MADFDAETTTADQPKDELVSGGGTQIVRPRGWWSKLVSAVRRFFVRRRHRRRK